MASINTPRIVSYKADGAIALGKAVKMGTDNQHVAVASAVGDKMIGIAQNAATTAGDLVEVALPGGGAKALSSGTIAAGKLLTAHTDGSLKVVAQANDRVVAMAMEDASASDVFSVEVVICQATATES